MPVQVNPRSVRNAEELIEHGDYRISTIWREAQPSLAAAERYLDQHGWDALSKWYLATNTDAPEGTLERLMFPIGDFRSVHRNGLLAAKQIAQQHQYPDVESAVDELIFLFDRISAC